MVKVHGRRCKVLSRTKRDTYPVKTIGISQWRRLSPGFGGTGFFDVPPKCEIWGGDGGEITVFSTLSVLNVCSVSTLVT